MTSLFVIQGADQGARFELDRLPASVGRDPGNLVQLHDREVSRFHAELRSSGENFVLFDLGSSNGTFVNGSRVSERKLATGDEVQIGSTLMLFTISEEGSGEDLAEKIKIITAQQADQSRIVRTISHEEGSRILDPHLNSSDSPWLARARSNLQIMYRTALAVSHTLDIDQLLARILQLIFEWVAADRGCIMLVDPETKRLEPKARQDRKGVDAKERLAISQTILDYVLEHKEGVLTSDAQEDTRWNPAASIVQNQIREAICVPMQGRYDVVGVIYIDTATPPGRVIQNGGGNQFQDEHLKLMIAIAHQAALAVEDTRYYSAMVQAERLAAVGQTIAMLSHHVKNILQGISGGSYLIEVGLENHDEEVVRKGWKMVEKNQSKISALVMDMLTFSKEREPEMLPENMNRVVADVIELMQVRAGELNVGLSYLPAEDMPTLTFDPEGMHRAILNVVTNALDACEKTPGGQVIVGTQYDSQESILRVTVEDNGPGIPAEDQEKIFSLFVSGKGARGTGLGLPVSNKIAKEHGGRIVVESRPGQGSRFLIELPAITPRSEPTNIDEPLFDSDNKETTDHSGIHHRPMAEGCNPRFEVRH
ncbi:MAG: FHA domain-containing protein [Planctomycetes bacterium]|nr:FHA domain-containing protein [Planctomycetota bacterium]